MRLASLLAVSVGLSLACQGCAAPSIIEVTALDPPSPTPESESAMSPGPDDSAAAALSTPTLAVLAPPACMTDESLDLATLGPELRKPLEAALAFLQSGGDPAGVQVSLEAQGILPDADESTYTPSVNAEIEDLDGDGTEEWLIDIVMPVSEFNASAALFIAFDCPDDTTPIRAFVTDDCQLGQCGYDFLVEDVAGLDYPQLLVLQKGAPDGWTCPYTHVLLTAPRASGWEVLLEAEPIRFNSACTVTLESHPGRMSKDIVLEGYRSGGGGSVPSRAVLEAYSWQEERHAFALSRREYLPSPYRIHVLEDAQYAIDQGQLGKALALYRIAMFDALIDFPSYAEQGIPPSVYDYQDEIPPPPFAYQTSFAKFRSVVLLEALGSHEAAQQYFRYMRTDVPGGEFKEMAALFLSSIEQGELWADACQAAARQIDDRYPLLLGDDGHIGYWDLSIVSYDVSTVCPSISGE